MADYAKRYRNLFDQFGLPLSESNGLSDSTIQKVADKLGCHIPRALADYYLVAGKLRRMNTGFHRFLPPKLWTVSENQLVFLAENQSVCHWGVSVRSKRIQNPTITQGINHDGEWEWHATDNKCFEFISIVLHYQAVNRGFRYRASAESPPDSYERLRDNGWKYAGELDGIWAFHKQNQVICILDGSGLPFMPNMLLMAAAKTKKDLAIIESSLEIPLKPKS